MIKPFCEWLATGLSLTIGTTLLEGWRPQDAPNACSVVLDRTGSIADPYLLVERELHYQILTRDTTYNLGYEAATDIYEWLIAKARRETQLHTGAGETGEEGEWTLHNIEGISPQFIGQDGKGRFEFSANYTLRVRKDA
jgi:hypothetical protein